MEYVEAGGAEIPQLGLGTWQNTGPQCATTVETALDLGYRHIDTAQAYNNESMVGDGIAAAGVERSEIFLTTKVWRTNLRAEKLKASVRESRAKLGVDYVDLLLVHWPHPRVPIEEPIGAMAELQADGVVNHIGVSNFTRGQLEAAIDAASTPIVTDQVLYHPFIDQTNLHEFCRANNVALTAYSPLVRGGVVGSDLLERIGEAYGKTAAQVALRWLLQQDNVVAIPKATGRSHLAENVDVFDFRLTEEEMMQINELKPGLRRRAQNLLPALMRHIPF